MKPLLTFLTIIIAINSVFGQIKNDTIINRFERSVHQTLPVNIWLDIHSEVKSLLIQGNYKNDPRFTYKFKTVKNPITGVWTKTASAAINYNGHIIALDTIYIQKKINELSKLDEKKFTPTTSVYFPNELEIFENDFQDSLNFNTEDGFHIKHYKKHYDVENKCWISKEPFIKYKIKNKQLYDTVYFYNLKGETLAKGVFINNKRDGVWYFKNQKDTVELKFEVSYKNGKRQGLFKYYENQILRCTGDVKNEMPIGEWKIFHKNGNIANFLTFLENPIVAKEDFVQMFFRKSNQLPSSNQSIYIPGFDYYRGKNIQTISFSRKKTVKFFLDGEFKSYYSNGQISTDWLYKNGVVLKGNKIYYENGQVSMEWILHKNKKKVTKITYKKDGSIFNTQKF